MPQRPLSVILIVVSSIALIGLLYMATLSACAVMRIEPPAPLLAAMKDVGLVSLGALAGLLARTSTGEGSTPVTVTNEKENPVPTEPQP